jgi:hypothetical protein
MTPSLYVEGSVCFHLAIEVVAVASPRRKVEHNKGVIVNIHEETSKSTAQIEFWIADSKGIWRVVK